MTTKNNTISRYKHFQSFLFIAAALSFITTKGGKTAHAAGLLVADGGFGGTLEIIEHDVEVTVNNGITEPIAAVFTLCKFKRHTTQNLQESIPIR